MSHPVKPSHSAGNVPGLASRHAALQAWLQVMKGRTLDEALEKSGWMSLPPRDRAFVRLLLFNVLRRRAALDGMLDEALSRRRGLPPALTGLLMLALAQKHLLQTPPHAVVSTTLALCDALRLGRNKKLAHGVLTRLMALPLPEMPPLQNLPDWLQILLRDYGDEAEAIAAALLQPAPLDLTTRQGAHAPGERLSQGSFRVPDGGDVTKLPGYAEGNWWVQDAGAACPVQLLGEVKGKHVLDLCAAPGGKTAQLADAGALVTAVDKDKGRLAQLRENLGRLKLDAAVIEADLLRWQPSRTYDFVVLDAPCSASGTIRRHPDLLWRKDDRNIMAAAGLQRQLLTRAAEWVGPGGKLLYVVCSLARAEGADVVNDFLSGHGGWRRAALPRLALGRVTPAGDWQSLPHDLPGGVDAFYAALLERPL